MKLIELELPLRTRSEMNTRSHWAARHRRFAEHRGVARLACTAKLPRARIPAVVTLTRIVCSAGLDDDNLRSALKAIRDGVADALGTDDRDPSVRWEYAQEKAPSRKHFGVRISIRIGGAT